MNNEDQFRNTRSTIKRLIDESKIPSLAVGVAQNGKILWMDGFGYADIENKTRATEFTSYPLASISKLFTATGLMILVEKGQLDLDQPVKKYLPKLEFTYHNGDPEDLTLRVLANHSSGLPTHFSYHYSDEETKPHPIPELLQRYGNIIAPPMERVLYANLGYGVLGHLIEETTGMSYAEFMDWEVFQPVGMKDSHMLNAITHEENDVTFYGPDDVPEYDENGQPRSVQYDGQFDMVPYHRSDTLGAAGVSSSVHDLLKFGLFHLNGGQILTKGSVNEMRNPTSAPAVINAPPSPFIDENTRYGVGWRISRLHGYEIAWHDGGMTGASTKLVLVPSENLVIVALCNRFQPQVTDQAVVSILSELLPEGPLPPLTPIYLPKDTPITGEYTGHIHANKKKTPLTLWINENEAYFKLGGEEKNPLFISSASNTYFWGVLRGNLTTQDTQRYPHDLSLDLKRRGDTLEGFALTMCIKTPRNRMGYALSHWTELRKTSEDA